MLAHECGIGRIHDQAHCERDTHTHTSWLVDAPEHQYQGDEIRDGREIAPGQ